MLEITDIKDIEITEVKPGEVIPAEEFWLNEDTPTIRSVAIKKHICRELNTSQKENRYEDLLEMMNKIKKEVSDCFHLSKYHAVHINHEQIKCYKELWHKFKLSPYADYSEILAKMNEMECQILMYKRMMNDKVERIEEKLKKVNTNG